LAKALLNFTDESDFLDDDYVKLNLDSRLNKNTPLENNNEKNIMCCCK